MTHCAIDARTTIADLSPDQRSLLAALAATPAQDAAYRDLAAALGWTEARTEHVATTLPAGTAARYTKTIHLRAIGLGPAGRELAQAVRAAGDTQLSLLMTEGAME